MMAGLCDLSFHFPTTSVRRLIMVLDYANMHDISKAGRCYACIVSRHSVITPFRIVCQLLELVIRIQTKLRENQIQFLLRCGHAFQ